MIASFQTKHTTRLATIVIISYHLCLLLNNIWVSVSQIILKLLGGEQTRNDMSLNTSTLNEVTN